MALCNSASVDHATHVVVGRGRASLHVGYAPVCDRKGIAPQHVETGQLRPMHRRKTVSLFEHLVGEREQCRRYFKAELLRGFEVDH